MVFKPHPSWGLKALNAYDLSQDKSFHFVVPPKTIPLPEFLVLSDADLKWYIDRAPTLVRYNIKQEHGASDPTLVSSTEIARKRKALLQRLTEREEEESLDLLTADEPIFLGSSHQEGGSSSASSSSSSSSSSSCLALTKKTSRGK